MISVSDHQLRIVAAAAELLPAEARGTFLQRVTCELRGRGDFSDRDVEQAVRAALPD
jgi:tRNA(Ser,Leu) C12 N-acetylase TAN1